MVIIDAAMADRFDPAPNILGRAGHLPTRAYIYYSRIESFAKRTGGNAVLALATVTAHELAHVILPIYSHGPEGLMKAGWQSWRETIPDFMPADAKQLRRAAVGRGRLDE